MQDRTYSDLLFLIQSLVGGGNLTTEEQGSIDSFINRRAHEAFQTSQTWPRFLVSSEERALSSYNLSRATDSTNPSVNQNYKFLGLAAASSITTGGTKVYNGLTTSNVLIFKNENNAWIVATTVTSSVNSDGVVTIADNGIWGAQFTEADSVKNNSIENVKTWTPRSVSSSDILNVSTQNLIPYDESLVPSIGEFLKVYRKKAFLNDSSLEYDFFVDFNGANILNVANTADNAAFVTYKKELPQYTITSIDIPGEWFFFIAHGSYADFLRMEGRVEQSMAEEDVAQKYLAQELEKVDNMSNNNVFRRFSTHGTRQSR